jgi:regulator of protease activity HflC (stomatin/prohibitin superfamily)
MKFFKNTFHSLKLWLDRHILGLIFISFVIVGGLIVLSPLMFVKIPAGYNGVLFRPLRGGVDLNNTFGEGLHIIFPFNTMTQYSISLQVYKLELDVMTSDLLKSKVTVSFQYATNELTLPLLHRYVGADYLNKLIVPEVTSATRAMFARFTSKEAFTSDLPQVISDISVSADNAVMAKLNPPGLEDVRLVKISAFQLESIAFPEGVQEAIANKITLSTQADAMKYKIDQAQQEVTRLTTEANGIKQFQDIVNPGLTEAYLRYRGIEASEKLAESTNAKIIVFGSSPTGLPLILGGDANSVSESTSNSSTKASSPPTVSKASTTSTPEKTSGTTAVNKASTASTPEKTTGITTSDKSTGTTSSDVKAGGTTNTDTKTGVTTNSSTKTDSPVATSTKK